MNTNGTGDYRRALANKQKVCVLFKQQKQDENIQITTV